MIVRKDPRQALLDDVLDSVSGDYETPRCICLRARRPFPKVNEALGDLADVGLIEMKTDEIDGDLCRRIDAAHARPHAEAALLAHFLRGGDREVGSFEELTLGHFWDPQSRALFDVMRQLTGLGKDLSLDLVLRAIRVLGKEARVGGAQFVKNLARRDQDVVRALELVRDAHALRQRRLVAEMVSKAPAMARIFDAQVEKLRRRARNEDQPIPLPFPTLAEALSGGLWPGVHVLTAGTGFGKTTLAMMIALHAALEGVPVIYFGLEAKHEEIIARLLGLRAGVRWSDLQLGKDLEGLEQSVLAHGPEIKALPFHPEVAPPFGWNASELYDRVAALRAKYSDEVYQKRPVLVVLDFLQIVASEGDRHEDSRQRIARASYAAAAVARDHDAAVLLVSSVARLHYDDVNKVRGKMTDHQLLGPVQNYVGLGKESGEIEFSADSLMVLVRVRDPGEQGIPKGGATTWLGIAKQRAGQSCWIPMRFDGGKFFEPPDGFDDLEELEASLVEQPDGGEGGEAQVAVVDPEANEFLEMA